MNKKEIKKQVEIKLLIFLDDDNKVKDRQVIILEKNALTVRMKFCDKDTGAVLNDSPAFELPWHRILKIKDIIGEEI